MEPSKRISKFLGDSIFGEIETLIHHDRPLLNLGSGFSEWDTPELLKEYQKEYLYAGQNQYGRTGGELFLTKAISRQYSPRFNKELDPAKEIVITHGATGGLTVACTAFLDEGDEVIIFEPSFESYFVQPKIFGGVVKTFSLEEPKGDSQQWTINFEEFEKLFNEKTRFLILNTPHNPTGKVFTRYEMEKFVAIAQKWPRLIIVTEEVYEYMCYDKHEHISIATMENMWERVISIYTASKTFACSGWRVGWVIASETLTAPMIAAHSWTNLGIHRPAQMAVAKAMDQFRESAATEDGRNYYEDLNKMLQKKKDFLVDTLENSWIKMKVHVPEGGFFVIVDITEAIPMIPREYFYKKVDGRYVDREKEGVKTEYSSDFAFVRWIADKFNIISIPGYPFYDQSGAKSVHEYKGSHLVRFALCKNDETLKGVADFLRKKD